jgi:hypothetical protein
VPLSRSNGRWKEKEKGLISLQVAPPALSAGASERCLLIGGVDYLYTAILDRLVAALLNGSMLAAMGPESVFLSVRPIVLSLARSTMPSSTTLFSNSRKVQRARPLGGLANGQHSYRSVVGSWDISWS